MDSKVTAPYDYGERESPSDDSLTKLRDLSHALILLKAQEFKQQEELEKTQKLIKQLTEQALPEVMADVGMRSITTTGGTRLTLVERIHASLPSVDKPIKRQRALAAVRRSGNEGLIKTEFRVSYGRNAEQHVERFRSLLREHGVDGDARISLTESIHPSTYKKFVKEQLASNPSLDLEEFGAYRQQLVEMDK